MKIKKIEDKFYKKCYLQFFLYKLITNFAPCGLLSKATIFPPCNSTIFLEIGNPNPEELSSDILLDLSTL